MMMNVLIPMAGAGARFIEQGYELPKPLIDVCGQPMIQRVIESLDSDKIDDVNFIFITLKEHLEDGLEEYLKNKGDIVVVENMTEGAPCTVLLAEKLINNDHE